MLSVFDVILPLRNVCWSPLLPVLKSAKCYHLSILSIVPVLIQKSNNGFLHSFRLRDCFINSLRLVTWEELYDVKRHEKKVKKIDIEIEQEKYGVLWVLFRSLLKTTIIQWSLVLTRSSLTTINITGWCEWEYAYLHILTSFINTKRSFGVLHHNTTGNKTFYGALTV